VARSVAADAPEGAYVVIDGRRWRATDPSIPEPLRVELVAELMAARRVVDRPRVHDAKVALGERGPKWWEPPTTAGDEERLAATIRTLVRHRGPDATICPSDAARAAGGSRWRTLMGPARAVARRLAGDGTIEILQRGAVVDPEGPWKGPIRLRLRER
jgi:hypothetical protein